MGMMKNLSSRLAQYNITCNEVAPAMIGSTGMIPSADAVPGVVEGIPLGRLGTPEEIASAVVMFVGNGYTTVGFFFGSLSSWFFLVVGVWEMEGALRGVV